MYGKIRAAHWYKWSKDHQLSFLPVRGGDVQEILAASGVFEFYVLMQWALAAVEAIAVGEGALVYFRDLFVGSS
jgi:hypothetical protein